MSEDIVLLNMLDSFRKIWKEEKILLTFRVSSLLGETLSRGKCGAGQEATLIDRTLERALWYLKDGVMTVGCRLCANWKHKWNSSGHVRSSPVVTLDRNAF